MIDQHCYACHDVCTHDFHVIDLRTEDGGEVRVAIHHACHERALHGGKRVYPERGYSTEPEVTFHVPMG